MDWKTYKILFSKIRLIRMNYLNDFWQLMGKHAGQIQILLAILAIILAGLAAKYAFDQIRQSQQQRLFEIKLSILGSAYECKDLIYDIRHQNDQLKTEFAKLLSLRNKTLDDNLDGEDYNYHAYFKMIISLMDEPNKVINTIIDELKDDEKVFKLDELEQYMKALVQVKGSIYSARNGYHRNIEIQKRSFDHYSNKISS